MSPAIGLSAVAGAVLKLFPDECAISLYGHEARAWASATFEGARHTIRLATDVRGRFDQAQAVLDRLDDHEFSIPGRLVADARVIRTMTGRLCGGWQMMAEIELLVLDYTQEQA